MIKDFLSVNKPTELMSSRSIGFSDNRWYDKNVFFIIVQSTFRDMLCKIIFLSLMEGNKRNNLRSANRNATLKSCGLSH